MIRTSPTISNLTCLRWQITIKTVINLVTYLDSKTMIRLLSWTPKDIQKKAKFRKMNRIAHLSLSIRSKNWEVQTYFSWSLAQTIFISILMVNLKLSFRILSHFLRCMKKAFLLNFGDTFVLLSPIGANQREHKRIEERRTLLKTISKIRSIRFWIKNLKAL